MRVVADFIAGLFQGVRAEESMHAPAARPRARRVARAPGVSTAAESAVRVALFFLAAGLLAVVALNIWKAPEPSKKHDPKALSTPATSADLTAVLAVDPDVEKRPWEYIVLHHSASARGSAQSFDQYHRQRGWAGLGYHFVIGNGTDQGDGVVIAGPRWYQQDAGAHAHSSLYNERGIGICLVGNFEEKGPSEAQMAALIELVRRLGREYKIDAEHIVGHNQIRRGGTLCPGRFFPMNDLRETIRNTK
jgi:N-acetyl-anhydromuramyl-L-alanine amidase AmpD